MELVSNLIDDLNWLHRLFILGASPTYNLPKVVLIQASCDDFVGC